MNDLRKAVIRLAKENPDIRPFLIPILKGEGHTASVDKSASPADTGAFACWAILSNPIGMTENNVKSALVSNGVSIKEPAADIPSAVRGPLSVGEIVLVDASKCVNPTNKKNCEALGFNPANPVYFIVKDVICPEDMDEKCTVVISPLLDGKVGSRTFNFEAALPTRIAGLLKDLERATKKGDLDKVLEVKRELREKSLTPHDGLGIYRSGFKNLAAYQKYLAMFEGQTQFVVVYERGGSAPTPAIRKDFVSTSVGARTRKTQMLGEFADIIDHVEAFSSRYYIGPIKYGMTGKDGSLYFAMDTKLSAGTDTFFSPSKGKVYFIAPLSELPSTWGEDLRARLADLANLEG